MESPGSVSRCPVRQQRARWERKRVCTARELLETERRYQEQLGLVATVGLRAGVRGSQTLLPQGWEFRPTPAISDCTSTLELPLATD